MDISRRGLIAGAGATVALAAMPGKAARAREDAGPAWYRGAMVIDGLGGIGDPYAPEDQLRFSDRARTELLSTGVTAVNLTVTPVGNDPDIWTKINHGLDMWGYVIAANPDFLVPVRKAGDLRAAKTAGKMGLIYGTQDTSMVGAALDRIAALKERGVRVMQLTYNLRNLSGDGSLEPGNAGLSRLGHATIERIEAEKLLLDLSHAGARTIREGIAAVNTREGLLMLTKRAASYYATPQIAFVEIDLPAMPSALVRRVDDHRPILQELDALLLRIAERYGVAA